MANKAKVKWNRYIAPKIVKQANKGLLHAVTDIYELSLSRTPIDEADLINNARISEQDDTGTYTLVVAYGIDDISREYAQIQHENLNYNHPNGGQAKFLESAYEELLPDVLPRIRQYVRNVII